MRFTWITLAFVLTLLAACASRPEGGAIKVSTVTAPGATMTDLLVATTRQRDKKGVAGFNGERVDGVDFATVSLSVPPNHKTGAIEWPDPLPGDPAKSFVIHSFSYVDGDGAFVARLKQRLASRPKGKRSVAVFVHGYNTDFDEGVFRAAQVFHDIGFDGEVVLFTWASRGRLVDYVYDRDSATIGRDGLERTLELISDSGADNIFLLAHSMGNWASMEALRQASIAGHPDFNGRLAGVVMASPDIDVDVFRSEMLRMGRPKMPIFLFTSADDKALAFSSLIAGEKPRLGAYTEDKKAIAELGVVVVDLSGASTDVDPLNHSSYAVAMPELVRRLNDRFAAGDKLTVDRRTLGDVVGATGGSLGNLVGSATGSIITLPTYLLTLPLRAIGR